MQLTSPILLAIHFDPGSICAFSKIMVHTQIKTLYSFEFSTKYYVTQSRFLLVVVVFLSWVKKKKSKETEIYLFIYLFMVYV